MADPIDIAAARAAWEALEAACAGLLASQCKWHRPYMGCPMDCRDIAGAIEEEFKIAQPLVAGVFDEIEQLRAKLDRWRNCFICLECGRGSVDEGGCCATCGRDSLQIVDGEIADTSIAARIDALDDDDQKLHAELAEARMLARDAQIQAMDRGASYQAISAELAEAHEALAAARSDVTERYFVTFSLGSHRHLLGPHRWNEAVAAQVEAMDIEGARDIRIESVEEVLRG